MWEAIKKDRLSLVFESSTRSDEGINFGAKQLTMVNRNLEEALESVTFAKKSRCALCK